MKRFKDLSIGDSFFKMSKKGHKFLDEVDEYKNVSEYSIIREIVIASIGELKEIIYFNIENSSYGNTHDLKLSNKKYLDSRFETDDDIYFADKDDFHNVVRDIVVAEINKTEKSILDYEVKQQQRIEDLRKKYFYSLTLEN